MEALLVTLGILCVLALVALSYTLSKLKIQIEHMDILRDRAEYSVKRSEETAKTVVEAHNGLSKRVIDMAGDIEVLRTRIEMTQARRT